MVRKIVRYIFTYLGAVFLMSYIIFANNVSAFDLTVGLTPVKRLVGSSNIYVHDNNTSTWSTGFQSYGHTQTYYSASSFTLTNSSHNWGTTTGHYYVITGRFDSSSDYAGTINSSGTMGIGTSTVNCPIIDLEVTDSWVDNIDNSQVTSYRQSFTLVCYENSSQTIGPTINLAMYLGNATTVEPYGVVFTGMFDFAKDSPISDVHTDLQNIYSWLQNNADDAGGTLRQEKQDVQNASDDSQDAGDDSTSDAEAGTASLISAIGSAVSAISSASPTNCRINGNMGNLNIGQIDLCANPVPTFVSVIGSLILILMVVPLCISLFNRFIGLFRSFQG